MSLNDPYAPATTLAPRLRVLNNGAEVGGACAIECTTHNYFQSSTFSAHFATSADPGHGLSWWGAQQPELLLDLQGSIDGGQSWKSLLVGAVDHMSVDPVRAEVSVDGRDLSSRLIDAKTRETFTNKTSSQIAEELAGRHGLTTDVQKTSTLVDRYYSADHDRITLNHFARITNEWDLLCYLAQNEGFLVWVSGTTLHFKPGPKADDDPWEVVWQPGPPVASNVDRLTMERSMYMAKDVVVEVRSWSSRQAKGITAFSPSGARGAGIQSGKEQQFAFVRPNLTQDQAQRLANQLREDITRHERLITFDAPGDLDLTAQSMARVTGTGTSWDQSYYIDNIRKSIDFRGGFKMTVHAKNHSPATSNLL